MTIVDGAPPGFRELHLENRACDARTFAMIQCRGCEAPGSVGRIQLDSHSGDHARDCVKLADLHAKLFPHEAISVRDVERALLQRCAERGQRNRPTCGEAFHQHPPAAPDIGFAADDPFHRHEDVAAIDRAVHEGAVHRPVASADVHTFVRNREQCARDSKLALTFGS